MSDSENTAPLVPPSPGVPPAGEATRPLSAPQGGSGATALPPAQNFPPPPSGAAPVSPHAPHSHAVPASWSATPAYATSAPRTAPGRVSGWVWPAVAGLALIVGLLGGALGGGIVGALDDNDGFGSSGDSPSAGRTVTAPPIGRGNSSVAAVAGELLPRTVQVMADAEGRPLAASGSGWVFDSAGHIITNNHVIAGAADGGKIQVVDHAGRTRSATLVGRSTVYDIAVLEVKDAKSLKPVSIGSTEEMLVGDPVVAIGSPLGLSETVTSGIISAKHRPVTTGDSADDTSYIDAVQTDAAINPGNSGGPLVNMQGQVIGVNSAIATTGGSILGGESGNIGVGFAIPIEQVLTTAEQILRTGKSQYPVIGATVVTGGKRDNNGAVIESVNEDSPAREAGLRKDDVIVGLDDERVTDGVSLIVMIRTHRPGDTLELTIERDGEERTVEVTLDGQDG